MGLILNGGTHSSESVTFTVAVDADDSFTSFVSVAVMQDRESKAHQLTSSQCTELDSASRHNMASIHQRD